MTTSTPGAVDELLSVRHVMKRFGATTALSDVSMTVRRGTSHALVGRNGAGKSTLVSLLTGLNSPDSGVLHFDGVEAPPLADRGAWRSKVACVYQHRTLVPEMTVAENLVLGQYGGQPGIKWREVLSFAERELDRWGLDLSPKERVEDLGVGEAQQVEIVRALSQGSRFVILDEPTAQLVSGEIRTLMDRINGLRERGVSFLYISHHLDEIPEVCDNVTVLRNGQDVLHAPVADVTTADIVTAMVGDDDLGRSVTVDAQSGATRVIDPTAAVALHADGIITDGLKEPFGLTLHAGEVVGLAGHAGSGSRAIAETIAGHRKKWTGSLTIEGAEIAGRWDSARAVGQGVTMVPEDRIKSGLVAGMTIKDNITMPSLALLSRAGMVDRRRQRRQAEDARRDLGIASASIEQNVGELSGGNQQKVLLGAALGPVPRVLVLVHPTAGVDIASKATIMQAIEEHRERGLAVILVSDEPWELAFCDRVQVWVRGTYAGEFKDINGKEIVAAMEGDTKTGEVA